MGLFRECWPMQSSLVERVPLLCWRVWAGGGAGVISVGGVHGFALGVLRHHARGHALHVITPASLFPATFSETADKRSVLVMVRVRQLGWSAPGWLSWGCNVVLKFILDGEVFTSGKVELTETLQLVGGRLTGIT